MPRPLHPGETTTEAGFGPTADFEILVNRNVSWDLRSSAVLRSVWWRFITDVSGTPHRSVKMGLIVPWRRLGISTVRCAISQKTAKSHLLRSGSLTSRTETSLIPVRKRTPDPSLIPVRKRTPDPSLIPVRKRTPDPSLIPVRKRTPDPSLIPVRKRTPDPYHIQYRDYALQK